MKYYYLFILIVGINTHLASEGSELNSDQVSQIENPIIRSQDEEKAVTNKADGLMVNSAYYIGKLHDEVTPMAVDDQFVMPVHKYGREDKEAGYRPDLRKPPHKLR